MKIRTINMVSMFLPHPSEEARSICLTSSAGQYVRRDDRFSVHIDTYSHFDGFLGVATGQFARIVIVHEPASAISTVRTPQARESFASNQKSKSDITFRLRNVILFCSEPSSRFRNGVGRSQDDHPWSTCSFWGRSAFPHSVRYL